MNIQIMPVEQLRQEFSNLESVNFCLQNEVTSLKEQIEWFRRQMFGQRSEKIIDNSHSDQLFLEGFDSLEEKIAEEKKVVKAHSRKKARRDGQDKIQLPDDLPVERTYIDLKTEEKICEVTGKALVKIGEEITKKLAYKPGSYYIKEIVRAKYALPKDSVGGIRIASLPEALLERCFADESFLADLMVKKYCDHTPIYRNCEILAREGIIISKQVLCEWIHRCGKALEPIYDIMLRLVLLSMNIFIDETPIDMQVKGKGKCQKAYMWVIVGGKSSDPPYRVYGFYPDRKYCNAEDMLGDYKGVLHSDKYGAYEQIAKRRDGITWCPCFSHIRRKFFEAVSGDPVFRQWILRKIRYLFMLEKIAWSRDEEERLRIRREKEEGIIDEIITKANERLIKGKYLPKSKFKNALCYIASLAPYLKNYLKHPFARLDNNVAERAIRPLAIGRKNWLFIGSERAGKSAATILSLVQSCRGLGINPREYLEDVMRRLNDHNYAKLYELLPDNWSRS